MSTRRNITPEERSATEVILARLTHAQGEVAYQLRTLLDKVQAAGIDNASQLDIDLLDATNEKLGTITEQIAEIRIVLGKDLRPEDTAGR
jgi:hypothetical protein